MKKLVKNRFTLVELLVSMAVFSILLVLMMQFFSGARTLWTANEKRAAIYADATVAMDLMSQLLQSTFYSDGNIPFAIRFAPAEAEKKAPRADDEKAINDDNIDGWRSEIYFVSNSPLELSKGGSVRYLSFQRKTDAGDTTVTRNVLELSVFSDSSVEDLKFDQCFAPFGLDVSSENKVDEARDYLLTVFRRVSHPCLSNKERKVVLRNVTGLKFTPINYRGKKIDGEECNVLPAGIEIELSLMENEQTIRDYQALAPGDRNDFRLKNEYTFRRTVWLGDRTHKFYE
ncbi:MAG: type II secretion system protein [Lentisphaerae bacterium]|nr:type II secretion system protein [Lentisphaerota bacterium]